MENGGWQVTMPACMTGDEGNGNLTSMGRARHLRIGKSPSQNRSRRGLPKRFKASHSRASTRLPFSPQVCCRPIPRAKFASR